MVKTDELTLIQVTDMHLQDDPLVDMHGVNPEQRFLKVLAEVADEPAELLLLTGDLTHHAPAAYPRLLNYVQELSYPSVWIPGNHDLLDEMQRYASQGLGEKRIDLPGWRILLLDSTAEPDGRGGGSLAKSELTFLQKELEQCDEHLHILVVLHHHPVSVGSEWQDQIALANADDFWRVLGTSKCVQAVIFGHTHQALTMEYNGVKLFSSPATAAQFVAKTQVSQIETDKLYSAPAYTRYNLTQNGNITMTVCRVTA